MKAFLKIKKTIKFCKFPNCRVMFRPNGSSTDLGLCYKHRKEVANKMKKIYNHKWYHSLSPERKLEFIRKYYPVRNRWIAKNIKRRREIALASYHRCKQKKN